MIYKILVLSFILTSGLTLQASQSTTPSEDMYACLKGFGYPEVIGSSLKLSHNFVVVPNKNKLFITNSIGTDEFSQLNGPTNTFAVQPVDERALFSITLTSDSTWPYKIGKSKIVPLRKMKLRTSDSETKLQSVVLEKANKDRSRATDFMNSLEVQFETTRQGASDSVTASLNLQAFWELYLKDIRTQSENLKSCANLNNGTIDQAVEIEKTFLEFESTAVTAQYIGSSIKVGNKAAR